MLSKKMLDAINKQINEEIFSAYLYLSMSSHFQNISLQGFANWMYVQYQEEMTHAMKFLNYINERNGKVVLKTIKEPQHSWTSPTTAIADALKHEEYITSKIYDLVNLAEKEKDYATKSMLQWYIDEQVEEEANAQKILDSLKLIGSSKDSLLMLDRELGQRVFVDETIAKK
jgi:ferritin